GLPVADAGGRAARARPRPRLAPAWAPVLGHGRSRRGWLSPWLQSEVALPARHQRMAGGAAMSAASVPREASIVAAILRALSRVEGLVVRKRWGGAMGSAGDPDLSGCYRGRHFEFEVKAPGGR